MKHKDIKLLFDGINQSSHFIFSDKRYIFFTPAVFFILLGLGIILMPRLFLTLIAAFLLVIGGFIGFIVWKFLKFKQKVERAFQGKIVIQGVELTGKRGLFDDLGGDVSPSGRESDSKKIILH